jgi:starch synthase
MKRAIRGLLRVYTTPSGERPFARVSLDEHRCLLAIVSRIDRQKIPIIAAAINSLQAIDGIQTTILGDHHPRDEYGRSQSDFLRNAAAASGDKIMYYQGWDIDLSHLIYGASDMVIVGSCWEPCGLTQLIAMRYGSIPLVRSCGGLADTVIDDLVGEHANGFAFREEVHDDNQTANVPEAAALLIQSIRRAITVWANKRERWFTLLKNGITRDSSWSKPAADYVELYHESLRRRVP